MSMPCLNSNDLEFVLASLVWGRVVRAVVSAEGCRDALKRRFDAIHCGTCAYIVNTAPFPSKGYHWVLAVCDVTVLTVRVRLVDPLPHPDTCNTLVNLLRRVGFHVVVEAMNWQNSNWECGYCCLYAISSLSHSLSMTTEFLRMPQDFPWLVQATLRLRCAPKALIWFFFVLREADRQTQILQTDTTDTDRYHRHRQKKKPKGGKHPGGPNPLGI